MPFAFLVIPFAVVAFLPVAIIVASVEALQALEVPGQQLGQRNGGG